MSVEISILSPHGGSIGGFAEVIGYVIAAVVKNPSDGAVTLEREIRTCADSRDDDELAESVVKTIEAKLNEVFPDPNQMVQVPETVLWVPE